MKLTIEHLAGYLPYGLHVYQRGYGLDLVQTMHAHTMMNLLDTETRYKPLLIPISALIPELELWLRELRGLNEEIPGSLYIPDDCKELPYFICQKVFELHGDMFGLIDAGLAINKLTYKEVQSGK